MSYLKNQLFLVGLLAGVSAMQAAGPLEIKDDPEAVDMNEVKELLTKLERGQSDKLDAVKEMAEKAVKQAETGEKAVKGFSDKVDEALTKFNEGDAAFKELEQKIARMGTGPGSAQFKSAGSHFVNSDEFKSIKDDGMVGGQRISVNVKTITSLTTDADGSAGDLVETQRIVNPLLQAPQRRMTVRDLITPGQMSGADISFVQETGFTNQAAAVLEGALKPESSLKFDLVNSKAKKLAHFMEASMEILEDALGLASMIDGRLRYGLDFIEEGQLLNGDGANGNILGLRTTATAYAPSFQVQDETNIDKVRLAMLQAMLAEYPASGIILNPINWADIETQKDTEGRYIIGNPQGTLSPSLWSLPVIVTQAMAVNEFLTGAFQNAAQLFDRMDTTVATSTEDKDNFRKNLVTILAEKRVALANYRPEAFIAGDLEAPTPVAP